MKNNFYLVDTSLYNNHKILYAEKIESWPYGRMGFYLLGSPIWYAKDENIDISVLKYFCADNLNDNICCDGQQIPLPSKISAKKIHLIGFCELGTVCEQLTLSFTDGTKKDYDFVFKTLHSNTWQGLDDNERNSKCTPSFYMRGDDGQKHNMYSWAISLDNTPYNLTKMILPVNLSMHIVSIVIES